MYFGSCCNPHCFSLNKSSEVSGYYLRRVPTFGIYLQLVLLGCYSVLNPFSPNIKIQILLTDLHMFTYSISLEYLLTDQSNLPLVIIFIHYLLITCSLDYVLILWRGVGGGGGAIGVRHSWGLKA